MRRRILLANNGGELTLSASGGTANASASSYVTFYVYYNGERLNDSAVTVSSDQSWATPKWTSGSSSNVKVTCTSNTDLDNTRSAIISVTYSGEDATYKLTQKKGTWDLSSTSRTTSCPSEIKYSFAIKINSSTTYTGTDYTLSVSDSSWITTSKSGGNIYYTASTNTNSSSRSGTIRVTFKGATKTYSISQGGTSALMEVRFSDGNTYSYGNWPSNKMPIGVVVPNTNACMSLKYMSITSPDNGSASSAYTYQTWGGRGYDIDGLTNYSTTASAISDMDGKANTAKILAVDNSNSTAWQTASTISSESTNQYVHPAAQCCWRYHTSGTSQGDWYLPSAGELYNAHMYTSKINCTIETLQNKYGSSIGGQLSDLYPYWSSSEKSSDSVYLVSLFGSGSYVYSENKVNKRYVRAFMRL